MKFQSRSLGGILIFVKRLKLSFAQEIQKMNGEEISKIQIEQYQKPSFYIRRCDSYIMSHTNRNHPPWALWKLAKAQRKSKSAWKNPNTWKWNFKNKIWKWFPSSKTQVSPHIGTILKDPRDRTISAVPLVSPLSRVKSEVGGPWGLTWAD